MKQTLALKAYSVDIDIGYKLCGSIISSDSQSLKFGGNTYAQYTLFPEGVGLTRQRRQDNRGPLRSTIGEELSLRFRTENKNGLLFHMSGFGSSGDSASIQVRFFSTFLMGKGECGRPLFLIFFQGRRFVSVQLKII